MIIGDNKGLWKAISTHRKPVEESWGKWCAEMVVDAPRTDAGDEREDLETMVIRPMTAAEQNSQRKSRYRGVSQYYVRIWKSMATQRVARAAFQCSEVQPFTYIRPDAGNEWRMR